MASRIRMAFVAAVGVVGALVPAAAVQAASPTAPSSPPAASPSAGAFVPVTPTRIEDTRTVSGGRLGPGGSATVTVPTSLVPAGAQAVSINVTAAGPSSVGNLVAYPGGTAKPATSTVNYDPSQDVADAAVIPLSAANSLSVTNNSAGSTDVVIDLDGYFTTVGATSTGAGHYYPLTPARITDTRPGSSQPNAGHTVGPASTLAVQVAGAGGVPASGVEAAVLNLTGTNTTAPADYLSVFPTGSARPTVSNLNEPARNTRANRVIVPLSSSGSVSVYNNAGSADVIVDVAGYFTDQTGSASDGSLFSPLSPTRVLDTHGTGGPFSSTPTTTALAGQAGLPPAGTTESATAAVLTVTEADSANVTTGSTYLTVYPAGGTPPLASDLNYPPGDTRPNLDLATLNAEGQIAGVVGSGTANAIYDVTGYFTPATPRPFSVSLAPTSGRPGTPVTGTITANRPPDGGRASPSALPASVVVDGCGLANQTEVVSGQGTFTFTIPPSTSPGACPITVTIDGRATTVPGGFTVAPASTETSYPPTFGGGSGVSCPTTTTCFAVGSRSGSNGGMVLATRNGGASWNTQTIPSDVSLNDSLSAVSCSSITNCAAIGSDALITTVNGGSTWTEHPIPSDITAMGASYADGLLDVSCPSATVCLAVGGNGSFQGVVLATSNGGATWTEQAIPYGTNTLDGVSCPSATVCTAVGNGVIATTNGGATWTKQAVPSGIDSLDRVSCPSTSTCIAVGSGTSGGAVIVTTTGGATWTRQPVPSDIAGLTDVSCASTSSCTAVGRNTVGAAVIATTNGGATWGEQALPSGVSGLSGVSCPSTSTCTAVGQRYLNGGSRASVIATTDGGHTWAQQPIPFGLNDLKGISCPSGTVCMAVGSNGGAGAGAAVIRTTDGGLTWTEQSVPSSVGGLSDVSCPTTVACTAIGSGLSGPVVITTKDGGNTWTTQTIPSGVSLADVSCPSTTACTAVGTDSSGRGVVFATTDGGGTWAEQTIPPGINELGAVSCPSSTVCTAVGYENGGTPAYSVVAIETMDGGVTWSDRILPPGVLDLSGLSCSSITACTAVGETRAYEGVVIATADGGASWTQQAVPAGTGRLSSVSCPASSLCTAAGDAFGSDATLIATTDGGATWTNQSIPADITHLGAVSCPAATVCTVVGGNDQGGATAYTYVSP